MDKNNSRTLIYWQNFIEGNNEAFAYFYNLHVEVLFRYGTKFCSDDNIVKDAIQEIFIDLYLKRNSNKTNPENLRFYLILALKRNLIKKLRQNRRLVDIEISDIEFEPEYSIEKLIIDDESEAELNLRLQEILKDLPAKQKEALYLRFNESMDYPEIAQILNISVESVRKQVYRALKALRNKMESKTLAFFLIAFKKPPNIKSLLSS